MTDFLSVPLNAPLDAPRNGLEQIIDIGPMGGKSNVLYWLEKRGIPCTEELVEAIYKRAKQSDRTLTEADVLVVVASVQPPEKLGTESH